MHSFNSKANMRPRMQRIIYIKRIYKVLENNKFKKV